MPLHKCTTYHGWLVAQPPPPPRPFFVNIVATKCFLVQLNEFFFKRKFFKVHPPPPCISYALVQATVGVGTVLIWDLILIRYQT